MVSWENSKLFYLVGTQDMCGGVTEDRIIQNVQAGGWLLPEAPEALNSFSQESDIIPFVLLFFKQLY